MKITDVRCILLARGPDREDDPRPFLSPMASFPGYAGSHTSWLSPAHEVLVAVDTDEGVTGYGEGRGFSGGMAFNVEHEFKKLLIGRDPFDVEQTWDMLYRASVRYGRKGTTIMAISAIDLALWDIIGRATNRPVYQLIGGRTRDAIQGYASGVVEDVPRFVAQGYRQIKIMARYGPQHGREGMRHNEEQVRAVREAVGPDGEVMIDAQAAWGVEYTIRMMDRLREYEVRFVEEPTMPDDYEGYAAIRRAIKPALVAGGEHEFTRWGVRELIDHDSVDIIQADPCRAGGITEMNKICALAQAYNLPVIPHTGAVYHCHVIMAHSNCPLVERAGGGAGGSTTTPSPPPARPGLESPLADAIQVRDSLVYVPDLPGFGTAPRWDVVEARRFRFAPGS